MELKENKKRMESKRKLNPTSEPRKGSNQARPPISLSQCFSQEFGPKIVKVSALFNFLS